MAQDIQTPPLPAGAERIARDYSWLTPSSLPQFLSEKLSVVWREQYPHTELRPHSPQEAAKCPGISWKIARRVPGKAAQDSQKGSVKVELSLSDSAEVVQLYSQWQTVTYEFSVYHNDVDKLHELTDAFENYLFHMQGELQRRQVENFLFEEELREDLASGRKAEDVPRRVLRYTAYVQKAYELSYPTISLIRMNTRNDIIEVSDMAVVRDDRLMYDLLDIPEETAVLIRVCDLTRDELRQLVYEARLAGGKSQMMATAGEHVFAENVDYQFTVLTLPTGLNKPAIVWKKTEGSRRPSPGTAYYISFHKAVEVKQSTLSPGA